MGDIIEFNPNLSLVVLYEWDESDYLIDLFKIKKVGNNCVFRFFFDTNRYMVIRLCGEQFYLAHQLKSDKKFIIDKKLLQKSTKEKYWLGSPMLVDKSILFPDKKTLEDAKEKLDNKEKHVSGNS